MNDILNLVIILMALLIIACSVYIAELVSAVKTMQQLYGDLERDHNRIIYQNRKLKERLRKNERFSVN